MQIANKPDYRVDTGPLRFGDDWPGIFIRGDQAGELSCQLKYISTKLDRHLSKKLLSIAKLLDSSYIPQQ